MELLVVIAIFAILAAMLAAPGTVVDRIQSSAQLSFLRRIALGDATATVQLSANLTTWVGQPISVSVQDTGALELVTVAAPRGSQHSPALRFRVYATVDSN